jgi:hypothetical protein
MKRKREGEGQEGQQEDESSVALRPNLTANDSASFGDASFFDDLELQHEPVLLTKEQQQVLSARLQQQASRPAAFEAACRALDEWLNAASAEEIGEWLAAGEGWEALVGNPPRMQL